MFSQNVSAYCDETFTGLVLGYVTYSTKIRGNWAELRTEKLLKNLCI